MRYMVIAWMIFLIPFSANAESGDHPWSKVYSKIHSEARSKFSWSTSTDKSTDSTLTSGAPAIPIENCDSDTIKREMEDSVRARQHIADDSFKKATDLSCLDKYKNLDIAGSFGVLDAAKLISGLRNQICSAADRIFSSVTQPINTSVWEATGGLGKVKVSPSGTSASTPGISGSASTYNTDAGIKVPNIFK